MRSFWRDPLIVSIISCLLGACLQIGLMYIKPQQTQQPPIRRTPPVVVVPTTPANKIPEPEKTHERMPTREVFPLDMPRRGSGHDRNYIPSR